MKSRHYLISLNDLCTVTDILTYPKYEDKWTVCQSWHTVFNKKLWPSPETKCTITKALWRTSCLMIDFSFVIMPLNMPVCQISFSKKSISFKQTNSVVKREILNQKDTILVYRQTENYRGCSIVPTMRYYHESMCLLKLEWLIIIRLNSYTM